MAELSFAEFEELAAARGDDPAQWPDELREAAERLLAGPDAAAARDVLDAMRELDAVLDDLAEAERAAPISDLLMARILVDASSITAERADFPRIAPDSPGASRSWLSDLVDMFGGWRAATASVAACVLVGLGLGFVAPDDAVTTLGFADAADEEIIADLGLVDEELANEVFGGAG